MAGARAYSLSRELLGGSRPAVFALALCTVVGALSTAWQPLRAEESEFVRQEVFRRINVGVRALKEGDYRSAADDLCWAASRSLNSLDAARLCGQALLASRDAERAVHFLELATDLSPDHLSSWVYLGDAQLARGDLDRARASYFRALDLRSDHSPAWTGLARLALARGDETQALEMFAKALEANPADAQTLLHRGRLHMEAGRTEQAAEDLEEAARLRPDDAEVLLGLARVQFRLGLLDRALAVTRRAAKLRPRDPEAAALEGMLLLRSASLPEAEEAARRALRLDPDMAEARLVLAEVLGSTGRIDQVAEALRTPDPFRVSEKEAASLEAAAARWQARKKHIDELSEQARSPDADVSLLLSLAEARRSTGERDEAVALVKRALLRSGGSPSVWRRAAYVLAEAGRFLASLEALARVESARAMTSRDWANKGVACERSGDASCAERSYRRALEYEDGDAETRAAALVGLARLALDDRQPDEARLHLEALLGERLAPELSARVKQAIERLDRFSDEATRSDRTQPGDTR